MGRRIRQRDLLPEDRLLGHTVHVVGCGAIGSNLAVQVGKMCGEHVNMVLWDDDEVSDENLSVQFFRKGDVGRPKAEVMAEIVADFDGPSSAQIQVRNERVTPDTILNGVVIVCVDSLEARREIFDAAFNGGANLLIDGRMGAEVCRVWGIDMDSPDEIEAYRRVTWTDEPVVAAPCTAKAIVYTAFGVSSLMVATLKQWLTGVERKSEVVLNFKTMDWLAAPSVARMKAEQAEADAKAEAA